ncbi:MAG: tRNA (adenosine(37)-N6)-dimethylallyltransferase MiaA [Acholeplasma sp.]|jgi:tRNA dimethylallyltransferase|nr:MAG: tRNA (adenosine(37)-N6)-dimethylallyltransferase MiaA [Acholeplasma sp.]
MKKFVILVGPTGSGKTGLSIQLAKHFGFEIINGDSVQVYKGLDIGSAKIKEVEKEGIIHHLIDIKDPQEPYSVFDFQRDVRMLIEHLERPFIVGGTGFYINAAISDFEFIEEKRDLDFDRAHDGISNDELYAKLIHLDPNVSIDPNNRRRVLRALEQALQGTPRSTKTKKNERLYQPLIIYLDVPKDELVKRLWLRLEKQIHDGFIDEVKQLRDQNIHLNMIGYREIDQYLSGEFTYDAMKEKVIKASKMLAKKQKTYFINQMKPLILDALSPTLLEDCIKHIKNYLEEN